MSNKAELTLNSAEMRSAGAKLIETLVEHWENMRELPVLGLADPAAWKSAIYEPMPEEGSALNGVLDQVCNSVLKSIAHTPHPRFFAFVPSTGNYVSVLANALSSGFSVFSGSWFQGSGPELIERQTIGWLCRLVGLPSNAGGLFLSGGSMANLTAMAVASKRKLPENKRAAGIVYVSDQTHVSVLRAVQLTGFSVRQVRVIPSDLLMGMDTSALASAIAEDKDSGLYPFCVVGTAGTTNTGAVDPLDDIADICARNGLWMHVDAAYGGAAMLCEEGERLLRGIQSADSVVIDPHKWLFQPSGCGCLLVRNPSDLVATFRLSAEYLGDDLSEESHDLWDYGPELTRPFRALGLWMSVQVFGVNAFRKSIVHGFQLARFAQATVERLSDWEIVTPARLATVTFRFAPPGADETLRDDLNKVIAARLAESGFAVIVPTKVRLHIVLRLCLINPRTTEADVRLTIEELARIASSIHQSVNGTDISRVFE